VKLSMSIVTMPDHSLRASPEPGAIGRRRISPILRVAVLSILALYIIAFRIHTWSEPPECDHATYAVIGHEMLRGRTLYSDLWDIKPPTIYATYAAAEVLVGYGKAQLFALGVLGGLVTLLGVERAGAVFGGSAGLWSAAFWAIACNAPDLQANQPNSEVFINALMVWSFVALAVGAPGRGGSRSALLAGILLAVASTYKQVIVFIAFLWALVQLATVRPRRAAAIQVAVVALPGVLLWAGLAAFYAGSERFGIFWRTNFLFSTRYSGSLLGNLATSMTPSGIGTLAKKAILLPLAAMSIAPFLFRKGGPGPRPLWLLAAWIAGTQVAIAAPGRFWPHYYQLWLPALAVGAGWGTSVIARQGWGRHRDLAWSPGALALSACLCLELPHFQLSPEQWSWRKYRDGFIESEKFGRTLVGLLKPGESFYQWGPHPEVYFASRLSPPVGVLWDDPLFEGPLQDELTTRTLEDLSARPPELVAVYTTRRNAGRSHAVLEWVEAHYRRVPGSHSPGDTLPELYVRAGGALEARLVPFDREVFRFKGEE